MTLIDYIFVYAIAAILVVIYFLRARKAPASRLNFRKQIPGQSYGTLKKKELESFHNKMNSMEKPTDSGYSKELNVLFEYDNKTWDAFQVLDIPAGSADKAVEKAYKEALQKVDSDSELFIKKAYEAIQKNKFKS